MLDDDDFQDELDAKTPLQRFGMPAAAVVFLVVAGAAAAYLLKGSSGPAPRPHMEPHITQVQLPPPPPPPPPPPKTPPPEPKKEVETTRPRESVPQKSSTPAPKAPSPPNQVQTSIAGAGPGALGVGNGGGDCIGAGCGTGDGTGGDNDAYYRNLVQSQMQDALRRDEKLRFAKFRMTVSFSLDASGHIARASVSSFSGDDDAQAEIERVLHAISTGDSPPAEMQAKQFSVRITAQARS
jgi:hypothetical protein